MGAARSSGLGFVWAEISALGTLSWGLFLAGWGWACSADETASRTRPAVLLDVPFSRLGPPADDEYSWKPETHSPRPAHTSSLAVGCDQTDQALVQVAERVVRRRLEQRPELESPELEFALRAEGCPYPWPRVWVLEGRELDPLELWSRWQRWLGELPPGGVRRCGMAELSRPGQTVVAAVVSSVLADLHPLPTRVRTGQWLTLEAELLEPADSAQVVVGGPRGRPWYPPTWLDSGRVRSSFSLGSPGTHTVQLLASVSSGLRPVAEAMIHVEVPEPRSFLVTEAPGEKARGPESDSARVLEQMISAARRLEGLVPLRREPELDLLAWAHAEAMCSTGMVSHDLGDGDIAARATARGIPARWVSENVAHAPSVELAHRSLWNSPSHRSNLLSNRFDALGLGVVRGPDGTVWVCEVFAAIEEHSPLTQKPTSRPDGRC